MEQVWYCVKIEVLFSPMLFILGYMSIIIQYPSSSILQHEDVLKNCSQLCLCIINSKVELSVTIVWRYRYTNEVKWVLKLRMLYWAFTSYRQVCSPLCQELQEWPSNILPPPQHQQSNEWEKIHIWYINIIKYFLAFSKKKKVFLQGRQHMAIV